MVHYINTHCLTIYLLIKKVSRGLPLNLACFHLAQNSPKQSDYVYIWVSQLIGNHRPGRVISPIFGSMCNCLRVQSYVELGVHY